MTNSLRMAADNLQKQIDAGRPGRHRFRVLVLGRLVTSGQFLVRMDLVHALRKLLIVQGDTAGRQGNLERRQRLEREATVALGSGTLETQGWTLFEHEGALFLRGLSECPTGLAPVPRSVIPDGDGEGAASPTPDQVADAGSLRLASGSIESFVSDDEAEGAVVAAASIFGDAGPDAGSSSPPERPNRKDVECRVLYPFASMS